MPRISPERHFDQRAMAADRCRDIDEIEATIGKERAGIGITPFDAELVTDDPQPLRIAVANRDDLRPADVVPSMHLVDGEEATADQGAA